VQNGSQQPGRASEVIAGADSASVASIVLVFIFRDAQRISTKIMPGI
jgi:hypothetical protein